mmetsp:Transcript_13641/g.57346  ORF Transcript_13641/g.57346 Transcript_13641/m.57346 type:complete len:280 (-) Transcript_13641:765-1604(-)
MSLNMSSYTSSTSATSRSRSAAHMPSSPPSDDVSPSDASTCTFPARAIRAVSASRVFTFTTPSSSRVRSKPSTSVSPETPRSSNKPLSFAALPDGTPRADTTRHCMTQQSRPPTDATSWSHHDTFAALTCEECALCASEGARRVAHGKFNTRKHPESSAETTCFPSPKRHTPLMSVPSAPFGHRPMSSNPKGVVHVCQPPRSSPPLCARVLRASTAKRGSRVTRRPLGASWHSTSYDVLLLRTAEPSAAQSMCKTPDACPTHLARRLYVRAFAPDARAR